MQLNGYRLGWTKVISNVMEGFALGPLLFSIFIDDIDEEVLCEISKIFDDTKMVNQVNNLNDTQAMQRTQNKLVAWVNRWEISSSM